MSDCFDTYRDRIADFRDRLQYVDGATGVAVAVGARVVSVDVFDKPETCQKVWGRLLSGVVFDALEADKAEKPADATAVERVLENSRGLSWEPSEAVGEGEEYRASSPQGDHASALLFDGVLVHGSVLAV
jgi:hypothetical protein